VRRFFGVLIVTGGITCLILLGLALASPDEGFAQRVNAWNIPVGLAGTAATFLGLWIAIRQRGEAEVARDLSRRVFDDRMRFLQLATMGNLDRGIARIDAKLTTGSDLGATGWEKLFRWQCSDDATESGSIDHIHNYYSNLSSGRMVILGPPGSGKTVALSLLVVGLIGPPHKGAVTPGRIPVYLSLDNFSVEGRSGVFSPVRSVARRAVASGPRWRFRLPHWKSRARTPKPAAIFEYWVARELSRRYGMSIGWSKRFAKNGLVIPIFDGLDEMDTPGGQFLGERATKFIDVLNRQPNQPFVVSSRTVEYNFRSRSHIQGASIVERAVHLTLSSLDPSAASEYLTRTHVLPNGRSEPRWSKFAAELTREASQPLLRTPLDLYLLMVAYEDPELDPTELFKIPGPERERRLWGALIPSIVQGSGIAQERGWSADAITRWLRSIARVQQREAAFEVDLPRLVTLDNEHDPLLLNFGGSDPLEFEHVGFGTLFAFALGTGGLGTTFAIPFWMSGFDHGAAASLWFASLISPFCFALAVNLFGRTAAKPRSVRATVRSRILRSTIMAFFLMCAGGAIALLILTPGKLFAGQLSPAVLVGCVVMWLLALRFGEIGGWWLYMYHIPVLAKRGLLPPRPALFIDWGLEVGLFRRSGAGIQFRHRNLQDWLTLMSPVDQSS
jgi:hypothetical protein